MATVIRGDTGIDKVADGADMPAGSVVKRISQQVSPLTLTSASYIDIATVNYTPEKIGNLLILEWRGVLSQNNSGASGGVMQWTKDGTGINVPGNGGELVLYSSTGFDQYHASTFYKETVSTSASHTFKLQAKVIGTVTNGFQLGGGWSINNVTITEVVQ